MTDSILACCRKVRGSGFRRGNGRIQLRGALDDIEQWVAQAPPAEHTVHIPAIVVGEPEQPEPEQPSGDNWARSLAFVRKAEGGWADDPNDPGGATMYGITMATYTRWRQKHGHPPPRRQSYAPSARQRRSASTTKWYWLESGRTDRMAWPMCVGAL